MTKFLALLMLKHSDGGSQLFLTHDIQDVVSYLSGSDSALFGVSLQYLKHGLQLVQSAVLTLLTDELPTHRLENTQQ